MEAAVDFALEAIESPEGRHASATENAEHALEHLRSRSEGWIFPNEKCSSKAGSSNSAVLFFAPRVTVLPLHR
jgi:hypothetical protein